MATSFTGGLFQAIGSNGLALAGGLLYTYEAGTLDPLATYTNQGGGVSNSNPVVCDVAGQARVWLGANTYRMILKTPGGVTVWDEDNLSAPVTLLDLADITSASNGAALSGYSDSLNYVARTVGARLHAIGADPRSLGAPANGTGDDTTYLTAALNYSKTLDLRNGTWKVTGPIDLPAGCCVLADGATITASNGSSPILRFLNGNAKLTVYGGLWRGTANSWLFLQGTTNQPTQQSHYASIINLYGVQVSDANITTAVVMDKAVKSYTSHGCNFFTPNGIDATNAKTVEVTDYGSIIFGATGTTGTFGVKLRAPGGTDKYHEGWGFYGSTVANFNVAHDIADFYQYKIIGGHHEGVGTSPYSLLVNPPSTTTLSEMPVVTGGATLKGAVKFVASSSGVSYHALLAGFQMQGVSGIHIEIGNNASDITIRDFHFKASTSGIGIVGATDNNAHIVIDGGEMDSSFIGGVQLKGTSGDGCAVSDLVYEGTGDSVYFERPVKLSNVTINTANVAAYKATYNSGNIGVPTTYAVGVDIVSVTVNCAKGETGDIDISLYCSGMNSTTQRLDITPPSGMVLRSGTGWSAAVHYPFMAAGAVCKRIPYYTTSKIVSGALTITNGAGNTVTINPHSYFGIVKD